MHMGGIMIECRLKSAILGHFSEDQRDWERSQNPNTQHCGIRNPGHDLHQALNKLEELGVITSPGSQIRDALTTIQDPLPGYSFINLRYYGGSLETSDYEDWKTEYQIFQTWLNQQLLSSS